MQYLPPSPLVFSLAYTCCQALFALLRVHSRSLHPVAKGNAVEAQVQASVASPTRYKTKRDICSEEFPSRRSAALNRRLFRRALHRRR